MTGGLLVLIILVLSIAYYVRGWSKTRQPLGKQLFGMTVGGTDGNPVASGKALLRYVGYVVSRIVLLSVFYGWNSTESVKDGTIG